MVFEEVVIAFLQAYTPALAFVAGLILGDSLILLAALAGAGELNILIIFVFALLGETVHDSAFFYFSKSRIVKYIKRKLELDKGKNRAAEMIEGLASRTGGYFVPLFLAKFVYGVRDSVVLYVGHKQKNFKKYILTCICASVCTLAIVLGLGWLAGRGFTEIIPVFKGIEKGVGILIIALVIAYIIYRLIGKFVIRIVRKYFDKIDKMIVS